MDTKRMLARLRALCQLDADAIVSYEAAMKQCVPEVAEKLGEFRADHVRHVEDLNELIRRYGGTAIALAPDLKGMVLRQVTSATSLIGTSGALLAMLGNEELTNRTYEWVLRGGLPPDVRDVLQRCYEEERRHLGWCKRALTQRLPFLRREHAAP